MPYAIGYLGSTVRVRTSTLHSRTMLALCAAWIAMLALLASAQASTIGAADTSSIREVIERQLNAFKRNDAKAAFAFAAPRVQQQFPTPELFMDVVKNGFGPIYGWRSHAFDAAGRVEGNVLQPVRILGPNNQLVIAVYVMEQQSDHSWKIGGVFLMEPAGENI